MKERMRDIQLSIKDKTAELETLHLESERNDNYIEFVQRELRQLYIELDDCMASFCGQTIVQSDVNETTVARGIDNMKERRN